MTTQDKIREAEDKLMYDFPKYYDNFRIIAYQNGIKKSFTAITKIIEERKLNE